MNRKYNLIRQKENPTPFELAFLSACECLYYGYSRAFWLQPCRGISKELLDQIWQEAVEAMTEEV